MARHSLRARRTWYGVWPVYFIGSTPCRSRAVDQRSQSLQVPNIHRYRSMYVKISCGRLKDMLWTSGKTINDNGPSRGPTSQPIWLIHSWSVAGCESTPERVRSLLRIRMSSSHAILGHGGTPRSWKLNRRAQIFANNGWRTIIRLLSMPEKGKEQLCILVRKWAVSEWSERLFQIFKCLHYYSE